MLRDVLSAGFRPFFLLAACNAWASMLPWLAVLAGVGVPTQGWPPHTLHAHEMIYGTVVPVIAGFLLTAAPTWTKTEPIRAAGLAGLVGLYLAGRVALVLAGPIDPWVVAAVDVAFLPVLAVCVGRPIVRARSWRNLPIVLVLLGLAAANATIHLGLARTNAGLLRGGTLAAVDLVVILMLVIAGRVIPLFTRNALLDRERAGRIETVPWAGAVAFSSGGLAMLGHLASPGHALVAPLALLAGAALVARMGRWQSGGTWRQPMLWVLHAGHLWIALGFVLMASSSWFGIGIGNVALHAFTAGAMGTLMLGMMCRVSLGHTGRPIEADRATQFAFACVIAGAAVRVASGFGPLEGYAAGLLLGGGLFSLAWFVYTVAYARTLVTARAA